MAVSQSQGCYKVILDCAEHNVDFYGKCGLSKKEVQMVRAASYPWCMAAYDSAAAVQDNLPSVRKYFLK